MTGVLEEPVLVAADRPRIEREVVDGAEGSHEHRRILDRIAILQGLGADAAEALGEAQRLAVARIVVNVSRSAVRASVRGHGVLHGVLEVGGLDDQGVAVPSADRVAVPLADVRSQGPRPVRVLRSDGDDADIAVGHHDAHVPGRLHDLLERLLAAPQHLARQAVSGDAPLGQSAVLPVVGLTALAPRLLARLPEGKGVAGQRRHAPIGGIDDLRRAQGDAGGGRVGAPERVVLGAGDAIAGPSVVRGVGPGVTLHVLLHQLLGDRVVVVIADDPAQPEALPLGRLLLGHELPHGELGRPFERGVGPGIPHALQIRIAPRGPRRHIVGLARFPGLPRLRRRRPCRRDHDRRANEHAPSKSHRPPPSGSTRPPYTYSSARSTHLNSSSRRLSSMRRYSGSRIVQWRVKTSGSAIVASYIR